MVQSGSRLPRGASLPLDAEPAEPVDAAAVPYSRPKCWITKRRGKLSMPLTNAAIRAIVPRDRQGRRHCGGQPTVDAPAAEAAGAAEVAVPVAGANPLNWVSVTPDDPASPLN